MHQRCEQRLLIVTVPDQLMSKSHARFVCSGKAWFVEDRGSKNGLVVNGEPATKTRLHDGDLIEIGATMFVFRHGPTKTSDPGHLSISFESAQVDPLATLNPWLASAFRRLEPVSRSEVSVLLNGETGTGKEWVARTIHERSERKGKFAGVNCGALPRGLIESSLFGHKKGAFSGATDDQRGFIRAADGGTLFLDEIAELPPPCQAALLRVLQEREVVPVGATAPIPVDIRLVSATNQNLPQLIEDGRFRRDLDARIRDFSLELPSLWERREDIGLLVGNILRGMDDHKNVSFRPSAMRALFAFDWPSNIRQLRSVVRTAVVQAMGQKVGTDHVPEEVRDAGARLAIRHETASHDRALLHRLLLEHKGNLSAVARAMQTSRSQVRRLCDKMRIDLGKYRP